MGRVLVVDDSRTMRLMMTTYLRRAGFDVEEAADGATALRMLVTNPPDVVLTDLQMPELDGFGLMEALKAHQTPPEVILVTGSQDQEVAIRALRLGAHDFLTKPLVGPDAVVLAVSRAIEKKRLRETNERLMRELEALCRVDGLTGVLNRRVFDEALQQEVARAERYNVPLSLAMFDIDHFKKINDGHGHQAGDEVLREFAARLVQGVRQTDQVFRYGGEEFAILFAHGDLGTSTTVCERLLAGVRELPIPAGSAALTITASAGVASAGRTGETPSSMVGRADKALYVAKQSGRNRVEVGD